MNLPQQRTCMQIVCARSIKKHLRINASAWLSVCETEIRDMFIDVLKRDRFFYNVDPDPAIAFVMNEMNETYETMSNDIEFGVRNGRR